MGWAFHKKMKTIAITNQRTGVGKTSITLSLGMALAERGMRVLLIDLDPQAALSAACGIEETESGKSIADVLGASHPGAVDINDILKEILPGHCCFLAPSDLALSRSEFGLNFRMGREAVLREALGKVSNDYDLALIDCPSSMGILTINALNSAHAVLIPIRPEMSDLRGALIFLTLLKRIKQEINHDLETLGVLVTFFNRSLEPHQNALDAMRDAGLPLLPVGINEEVPESKMHADVEAKLINVPGDPHTRIQLAELVEQWLAGWRAWRPTINEG